MKELLHACFELKNPAERWVTSRVPSLNIAFALAEVIWIVRGRNDAAFLNYFNRELPKFAGDSPTYHGAYGYRLRKSLGIDQLERAYSALKGQPNSRQVVLQIWDGRMDLPHENGSPLSPDIPCNLMSMIKVREGRLEWSQIMRSNDLFLGWVHNVVQFTCLQEIMAGWLEIPAGSYHHFSDSLHVYERDVLHLQEAKSDPVLDYVDRLDVGKTQSDDIFSTLEQLVDDVISSECSVSSLLKRWKNLELPVAYANIASVIICEGLRRRGGTSEIFTVLDQCTNPTYILLYERWLDRVKSKI